MTVKDDVGYVKPISYQPVPTTPTTKKPVALENASKDTKSWWDKVVQYGSQIFQGLYVGAQAGLDIYQRYKLIESGKVTESYIPGGGVSKEGQIVILGQEINKQYLYIFGALLLVILIIMLIRK